MTLIVENQLFPCVDVVKGLSQNKHVKIDKYETFQKTSFRNRYMIATANGVIGLTVPVVGGREQKRGITEVEIDFTDNWPTKHWRGITSAYMKAPFFDYYSEEIRKLLFIDEKNLFNFNILILTKICNLLDINVKIDFTDCYQHAVEGVDYRNKFLPKNYQNVDGNWRPRYSQVFEEQIGFQPNLSILDLLFCEGPNAVRLLEETPSTR